METLQATLVPEPDDTLWVLATYDRYNNWEPRFQCYNTEESLKKAIDENKKWHSSMHSLVYTYQVKVPRPQSLIDDLVKQSLISSR